MNTEATKTAALQGQFICPIWAVWYGAPVLDCFTGETCAPAKASVSVYFTRYHAEQFVRALTLNGTACRAFDGKGVAI